jgi:hypothetical protein
MKKGKTWHNTHFNDESGLPDHGMKTVVLNEETKEVITKPLTTNRAKAILF